MKKLNILKNIDQFLFSKLDILQEKPEFKKINEHYSTLEERMQEIVKAALAISILAVPLLVISFYSMSNSTLTESLAIKENIIELAHSYVKDQALVKTEENSILGRQKVANQSDFQTKIISLINSIGIDSSKIQISSFNSDNLPGNIIESKINLKYNSLSNDNLFTLLSAMVNKERIKVDTISVTKNKASNLLDGILTIFYFSKDDIDE